MGPSSKARNLPVLHVASVGRRDFAHRNGELIRPRDDGLCERAGWGTAVQHGDARTAQCSVFATAQFGSFESGVSVHHEPRERSAQHVSKTFYSKALRCIPGIQALSPRIVVC